MKIETKNYSIEVTGIEFDSNAFAPATLAWFDSLVIDGLVKFTYDEFKEMPVSTYREIWEALDNAANQACDEFRANAADIRAWFRARG
jgi:hypothetical protein